MESSYKNFLLDFDGTICRLDVDWKGLKSEIVNSFPDFNLGGMRLMEMVALIYLTDQLHIRHRLWSIIDSFERPDGLARYATLNLNLLALKGHKIIVSNNLSSTIESVLTDLGQLDKVDAVLGIDRLFAPKPNAEVFHRIQTMVNDFSVEDYVMIGDSEIDKEFALNCGIEFKYEAEYHEK